MIDEQSLLESLLDFCSWRINSKLSVQPRAVGQILNSLPGTNLNQPSGKQRPLFAFATCQMHPDHGKLTTKSGAQPKTGLNERKLAAFYYAHKLAYQTSFDSATIHDYNYS